MGELRVQVHTGWTCSARSCETTYRYHGRDGEHIPTDYLGDRSISRERATAAGWLFIDGRTVRPFCPAHAADAQARACAIETAREEYLANYETTMGATR